MKEETYDKAIEAFKKLLDIYPEDSIGNTNLGITYFALERWDQAINHSKVNIQNKSGTLISYWNLVEGYMAKGLYGIAKKTLEEALESYPDSAGLYFKLALLYTCQGNYDLALAELDKASKLDKSAEIQSVFRKGENYLLKGDIGKAQQEFGKFVAGTGWSRNGLALLYLAQGRLNEAIEIRRTEPLPHEWLGRLYLKTGKFKLALKEFDEMNKEALLVESLFNQMRALHYKGLAYLGLKSMADVSEIAAELRQMIQKSLSRKRIRYYYHLMGMVELENERYVEAIDYFEKAISLLRSPYDIEVEDHPMFIDSDSLALAYYKTGELAMAQEQYETIQSLTYHRIRDGDIFAKSYFMLGKIAENKKEKSKAIEYYETFLNLWKDADPGIPELDDARNRLAALKNQ